MAGSRGSGRGEGSVPPSAVAVDPEWVAPRRSFLEAHPWLVDGTIAAVYTAPLVLTRVYGMILGEYDAPLWQIAVTILTGVALLFRRYRPVTVLVAVSLLTTLATWSLDAGNDILAVAIALYAVAAFRSPRLAWLCAGGALVVGAAGLLLWSPLIPGDQTDRYSFWNLLLLFALASAIGVLLGSLAHGRRQRLRALEERAEQLARERDNQATIATLAERSRIAREMHDIVAHSLSVMVALADGAAAAVERDPAQSKRALEMVSETGRSALADMRSVLSVLREARDGDAPPRPAPGHRDLAELVERFRSAGMPVRFSVTGVAPQHPAHELTLYRIVQESLTNVLRYGRNVGRVQVRVDYAEDGTTVIVDDDGGRPGEDGLAEARTASVGSGRGVIGMEERAGMLGGHVEAGPLPDRGWRVSAVLPIEQGATREAQR